MAKVNLAALGREWACMAIRHNCQPTTTGNLEHDRACAEEFLKHTGAPPEWYTVERFGLIKDPNSNRQAWKPSKATK